MKRHSRRPESIPVHVKGKNLTVTAGLRDHAVHKMRGLNRYMDRLQDIEVELSTEATREAVGHNRVDATTVVAGTPVRVTTHALDMYAAIDEAVDKLYRQLVRRKERMKTHRRGELSSVGESDLDENRPEETIYVRRVEMKPQFEDEAAQDLDDLGRSFHVFLNARTEQVNVLYRRSDGGLCLIEPQT